MITPKEILIHLIFFTNKKIVNFFESYLQQIFLLNFVVFIIVESIHLRFFEFAFVFVSLILAFSWFLIFLLNLFVNFLFWWLIKDKT